MSKRYDVIVIGGGHAGIEAAWATSRLGHGTALVTMDVDAIGRLSCNPAIGGLGKGHMVREIDALGGLMAFLADEAGLQFRILNKSKGPAVWAPRAQTDRELYPAAAQRYLSAANNLDIVEGTVEDFLTRPVEVENDPQHRMTGVALNGGRRLSAPIVIVTTGTFLRALMHCGRDKTTGGRVGEGSAEGISSTLQSLGFELGRLKTGTPPRVHRDSIRYDDLEEQPGDDPPVPFSFMNSSVDRRQLMCWITHTNAKSHEIIRDHLDEAPMYTGQISSQGPRYCPSIEDKVVRFADKPRHQLFLEPEGFECERVYCNGISTSLPPYVQEQLVHSIAGLEDAVILQHGYAVEYDWVPTHQIRATLETKLVDGLFLAGQINGTSGYEEAAAQGLWAGVNASRKLIQQEPMILGRDEAYIGVMIDDLITKPPTEPYRMFTSRAEYRLHLRSDNADQRLTPIGRRVGLVDDERWDAYSAKAGEMESLAKTLKSVTKGGKRLVDWLPRTDFSESDLRRCLADNQCDAFSDGVILQALTNARYAGYVTRQRKQIERFRKMESMLLPEHINFASVNELRLEARERFAKVRPRTLGQASRINGIISSDISVLCVLLHRMAGDSATD
jgi:tRNA uridine 5-carboxymethylaminomethyl modification enzyme